MIIGLYASAFNPMHAGHLWAIKQAIQSGACEGVLAAVQLDPSIERTGKRKPIWCCYERSEMIFCCPGVIGTAFYDTEESLRSLIAKYRPEVLIVGEDHRHDSVTGGDLGIPIFWAKRRPGWSSTEFVDAIYRHERDRRAEQASEIIQAQGNPADHRGVQA